MDPNFKANGSIGIFKQDNYHCGLTSKLIFCNVKIQVAFSDLNVTKRMFSPNKWNYNKYWYFSTGREIKVKSFKVDSKIRDLGRQKWRWSFGLNGKEAIQVDKKGIGHLG
jgi:hypothetical protein